MTKSRIRCAIYTRKSSEEGLEQEFNSLEAQRSACEAYIKSQAHEGWRAIPERFDDGGHSGGTLDRPALQRLLEAIRNRRVDVIVIYKIDRLTRSLMDFAKLAELFDKEGVSFVSVTQQFNTTTSMGRLMLNVLLSFAQFEREITGERIRDKIAASKKKGMWMGGTPPIGYRAQDRTLVVEPEDAETVRRIFRLYLEAGTVRRLVQILDERGIRTKRRTHSDGSVSGGGRFQRGHLYGLLSNPIYIGRIGHKGQSYPGTHEPIIDQATWKAVQNRLAQNTQGPRKRDRPGLKGASPLAGRLYAENGNRFAPSHATKAGRRYRYYVEQLPEGTATAERKPWRIPAEEIEGAVKSAMHNLLGSRQRVLNAIGKLSVAETQLALNGARSLQTILVDSTQAKAGEALASMLRKVVLSKDRILLSLHRRGFSEALGVSSVNDMKESINEVTLEFEAPVQVRRRGLQAKLIVGQGISSPSRNHDPALLKAIARAHDWFGRLKSGEADSIEAIALTEGVTGPYVTRVVRLAFLQPELIERILQGTQAVEISVERLTLRKDIPVRWREQAIALSKQDAN